MSIMAGGHGPRQADGKRHQSAISRSLTDWSPSQRSPKTSREGRQATTRMTDKDKAVGRLRLAVEPGLAEGAASADGWRGGAMTQDARQIWLRSANQAAK
jgi:hypothetical protein